MRWLCLPLVAVAACRSGRVHRQDVARCFRVEYARVEWHVPSAEELPPRAAGSAMDETARLARVFLEGRRREDRHSRYVRALLACAHLLRGERDLARSAVEVIPPYSRQLLSHEESVVEATLHAVDGCRALEARLALDDYLEGRLDARDFLDRHAAWFGIELPREDRGLRERELARQAAALRLRCFSDPPGDPHGMERAAQAGRELRRAATEMVYDEAAALLGALPAEHKADTECLAAFTTGLFIVHGYLMSDLVPYRLSTEQKRWMREQAASVYARARAASERFLGAERYALLRYRLDAAELMTAGWIETR